MQSTLTLSLSGLPDNDRLVLFALFTLADSQLSTKWQLATGEQADAMFIENVEGANLMLLRPVRTVGGDTAAYQLKRPFQAPDLIKALETAGRALTNQGAVSGGLAAALVQLRNDLAYSEAVWSLSVPDGGKLWVCTKQSGYWLDGGDNLLSKLDQLPYLEWSQEPREALGQLMSEREMQPLFRLYWMGGMVSGRGKLLPWLNSSTPWHLATWPSFFKLPHYPTFPRMAAAAMKKPMTLDELIAFCGNNRSAAIEFVNASVMAGFLCEAQGYTAPAAGNSKAAAAAPAKEGLISRIRRKLGLL